MIFFFNFKFRKLLRKVMTLKIYLHMAKNSIIQQLIGSKCHMYFVFYPKLLLNRERKQFLVGFFFLSCSPPAFM